MTSRIPALLISCTALSACTTMADTQALAPMEIQILALNDFHGNLQAPSSTTTFLDGQEVKQEALGGAARMGAKLARLRGGQEHSITVAAGDLIGASPFVSANFLDEPSIVALGQMGLDLASVGNHEFDRGVDELRRMQDGGCQKLTSRTPCALDVFPGAEFTYLAGNVVDEDNAAVFTGTAMRTFGPVQLGFIGLTLKDTASLVSPSATDGYRFLDEAGTANALARELVEQGADSVVLLIHEGGRTEPFNNISGCPGLSGSIVPILQALSGSIGLVVSGHTHNAYACEVTRAGKEPLMLTSAGRYGTFVTDIRLGVDALSGEVTSLSAINVPISPSEDEQPDIAALVGRYVAAAQPIADRVVGEVLPALEVGANCIERPSQQLVADAQLAFANSQIEGGIDIAFINSGGVRTDLASAADGVMTYGEIFAMQPFGNRLVVLDMSGQQIAHLLEQQICGDGFCYSYMIPSVGFTYAFDRAQPAGQRIVSMMLNGQAIDSDARYQLAVNNFLASGGDGFTAFAGAVVIGDAGLDVDALEAYLANGVQVPVCGRIRDLTGS